MPRKPRTDSRGNSVPPGRGPGGMGNPYEDRYFYEGYRDFNREPRIDDVIIGPTCSPGAANPELKSRMEALKCTLNDVFARQVVFTKFPANSQPPWFAKPIIKCKNITIASGGTGVIFDREIPGRNRAILTCLGIDIDPVGAILAQTCEFWFDLGNQEEIVDIFDDQTETAYEEVDGLTSGKTTVLPGSLVVPFNFLEAGLQFMIKGPKMLRFMMENKGLEAVTIRGMMGYYQYPLPYGATEFENADVML